MIFLLFFTGTHAIAAQGLFCVELFKNTRSRVVSVVTHVPPTSTLRHVGRDAARDTARDNSLLTALQKPFPADVETYWFEYAFLSHDIARRLENGKVDIKETVRALKRVVGQLSEIDRNSRSAELKDLINRISSHQNIQQYQKTNFWILLIALDPIGSLSQVTREVVENDVSPFWSQPIAEFVLQFDQNLARKLAVQLLAKIETADKNLDSKTIEWIRQNKTTTLPTPPHRTIAFMTKVLMDYPRLFSEEVSPNNGIRFGTYERFIQSTSALLVEAGIGTVPPSAREVGVVLKAIQDHLRVWKSQNPNEEASIVVKGTFFNGLAVRPSSDIDMMTANQSLRWTIAPVFNVGMKMQIQNALKQAGSNRSISIDGGIPSFFNDPDFSSERVRTVGYLQTISFEVFEDRIDIIVHDHRGLNPGEMNSYRLYRTE